MMCTLLDTKKVVFEFDLNDMKYAPASNSAMCISASILLFSGRKFITQIFIKSLNLDTELKKLLKSVANDDQIGKVKINYPLFLKKNNTNNLFSRVKKDDFV